MKTLFTVKSEKEVKELVKQISKGAKNK